MEGHLLLKCVGQRTEPDGSVIVGFEPEQLAQAPFAADAAIVKAEIVLRIRAPEQYVVGQSYWLSIE